MKILVLLVLFALLISLVSALWPVYIVLAILFVIWKIYELSYYKSTGFLEIKNRIETYIKDCNDLNQHIESLKNSDVIANQTDYGKASYQDSSKWHYKRKHLKTQKYAPYIYNCSRTICDNARKKPFEYICKYFGITANEANLEKFENILNNFEAAEEGKQRLCDEKEKIMQALANDIPVLIQKLSRKKLESKLGFQAIDMSTQYFPKYVFKYVSSGGNASTECNIVMDIDNLNKFVKFLSEKIRFRKSAAGQRALMTSKLRQKIKERDGFTCKQCGASIEKEPNLLLEIDHIIPIAKGGLTTEDNLQTLCWRCNRRKGSKI